MKKLTESEAQAIITKPPGRVSYIRAMLLDMKPGDIFLIEKKEWNWKKKTPTAMCRRLEQRTALKFDCRRALDGSGWVVKRLK